MKKVIHVVEWDFIQRLLLSRQPPPFPTGTIYVRPEANKQEWCVCRLRSRSNATCSEEITSMHPTEREAKQQLMRLLIKNRNNKSSGASTNEQETPLRIKPRYWRTPPNIYDALNTEFAIDFDACPYPRPAGYDSLKIEWGKVSYVNPPFRAADGIAGKGPTAFVRKAIEEHEKGKTIVLIVPVQSYVNMLLEAGAESRPLGRVRWLEAETLEPSPNPTTVACFILRGGAK